MIKDVYWQYCIDIGYEKYVFKLLYIPVMLLMATAIVILETNILSPISFCNINASKLNVHKSNSCKWYIRRR